MSGKSQALPIQMPLNGLLDRAFDAMIAEFRGEIERSDFRDLRPTHGCVFRYLQGRSMRLTEMAERANMTKQSVGEIVDDLVGLGYVERIPDPADRRAKLICLTGRGEEAQAFGFRTLAEIEGRWAERCGAGRIAALRKTLEAIVAVELPLAVPEPATSSHA